MTDAQTADFLENEKKRKATHNILDSTDEEHIFRKIDLGKTTQHQKLYLIFQKGGVIYLRISKSYMSSEYVYLISIQKLDFIRSD